MPEEIETMAKRLKLYREHIKQSQFEASCETCEIGISVEELSNLERCCTDPRFSTLGKVARYMGVGVPALITPERTGAAVYGLLRGPGIASNYIGYFQTAQAVEICVESPDKLTQMTKQVYAEVGKRYRVNWTSIERNIRTVVKMAYKRRPEAVESLMRFGLTAHPKSFEFIAALAARVLSGDYALDE